jgi:predicted Zn-dependent protease
MKEVPLGLFDKQRNQWRSNGILQWLLQKYKPDRGTSTTTKILAICDFDAYSYGLNFVLGEAYLGGSVTAIYLPRLRQEFYGLEINEPPLLIIYILLMRGGVLTISLAKIKQCF